MTQTRLDQRSQLSAHLRLRWALLLSVSVHVAGILSTSPMPGAHFKPVWQTPQTGQRRPLTVSIQANKTPRTDALPAIQLTVPQLDPSPQGLRLEQKATSEPNPIALKQTEAALTQGNYIPANRLSQPPIPIDIGTLDIPGLAKPTESGHLILEIMVNEFGRADGVRVIESTMQAPYLANAIRAFQRGIFEPGRELNKPVKSLLKIEVVLTNGMTEASQIQMRSQSPIYDSLRFP